MKPIIIVLFLAAGPARAADPYVFIPPVLPARQGDLAELSYRLAQLPALSELERAQTAAAVSHRGIRAGACGHRRRRL